MISSIDENSQQPATYFVDHPRTYRGSSHFIVPVSHNGIDLKMGTNISMFAESDLPFNYETTREKRTRSAFSVCIL